MSLGKSALCGAFATLVASTATPASACNFLQDLFGACKSAPEAAAPAPSLESNLPAEKKAPRQAHAFVPRKQAPLAPPEGAKVGSLAHFSNDTTLRKGDIVVTPSGFLVFNGAAVGERMQAFAPIGDKSGALAEMQNESLKSDWTASTRPSLAGLAAQPAVQKPAPKRAVRRVAAKTSSEQM
jgi:hypothetical protein